MARARKQKEIPGTERKRDEEIATAAEDLHEVRTERMQLTTKETAAAQRLVEIMERKGVETYVDEELQIKVTLKFGGTKVSVQKIKEPEAEAAE